MKSINSKVSKFYQRSQSYSLAASVSFIYVVSILHFALYYFHIDFFIFL